MHLIDALAAGIKGAESGTFAIHKRGTTVPATYYTDFEADDSGATTVAGSLPSLDANGAFVAYVNELVDAKAYDTSGNLVRKFTSGHNATAIEVKSQSFTGTNYETGASAANQPTTLQAVLDKVKDSFGSTDFQVLVNGAATNLSTVVSGLTSRVYNVQDAAYGAVGDGATDDASAIQAAITAANSDGGGTVYFPPGTYLFATGLNVSDGVSLLGSGPGTSVLVSDASAVATAITLAASSAVAMEGLTLRPDDLSATTGKLIAAGGTSLRVTDCTIGSSSASHGTRTGIDLTSGSADLLRCSVYIPAVASISSAVGIDVDGGTRTTITSCSIASVGTTPGSSPNGVATASSSSGADVTVIGTSVNFSSITSASSAIAYEALDTDDVFNVFGGSIVGTGGASVAYAVSAAALSKSPALVSVDLGSNVDLSASGYGTIYRSGYRNQSDNSATVTVDPVMYGFERISRTDGTALTVDVDTTTYAGGIVGTTFHLMVSNSTGGTTITFGTGLNFGATVVLPSGESRIFSFICYSATQWGVVGSGVDF